MDRADGQKRQAIKIRYYPGERIYFRPAEPEDEPWIRAWRNDPATWVTLGDIGPLNALRGRERLDKLHKDTSDVVFMICLKDGDRPVGCCGLHGVGDTHRNAEFGILIGEREHRRRGYGTEATRLMVRYGFEELNLHRIGLSCLGGNPGGARAYEKAGFVPEGCAAEAYFRGGSYHDELFYGLLREEWGSQGMSR